LTWETSDDGAEEPVWFKRGLYLGGLPGLPKAVKGNLRFGAEGIGIGTPYPDGPLVPIADVDSVEVSGGQVAKSKIGAVLAFGVLGGLAAKGADDNTTVTVHIRGGNAAYYRLERWSPEEVRANIAPWLHAVRISFEGESGMDSDASQQPFLSKADELLKLADLRDRGVLTDDEFAAEKARVLGS
jgi:hypothetical protein